MEVRMVAHTVGVGPDRAVAQLRAVPDHEDETAPGGSAHIIVNDPDLLDDFEEGVEYVVTFSRTKGGASSVAADLVKQAAAIQNSTNTRGFKTPTAQKAVPPTVPDGVVTVPRPSVVLASPADAGWDAEQTAVPAQAAVALVVPEAPATASTPAPPGQAKK